MSVRDAQMTTRKPKLGTRARHVLRELLGENVDLTPEIVAQVSEIRLKAIWGCGQTTFREIQDWLAAHGLKLSRDRAFRERPRSDRDEVQD